MWNRRPWPSHVSVPLSANTGYRGRAWVSSLWQTRELCRFRTWLHWGHGSCLRATTWAFSRWRFSVVFVANFRLQSGHCLASAVRLNTGWGKLVSVSGVPGSTTPTFTCNIMLSYQLNRACRQCCGSRSERIRTFLLDPDPNNRL